MGVAPLGPCYKVLVSVTREKVMLECAGVAKGEVLLEGAGQSVIREVMLEGARVGNKIGHVSRWCWCR